MESKVPEGYMRDSQGRLVPTEMVKPIDLTRDELVKEIVNKALTLSKMLSEFKAKAMDDIEAFVSLSLEKYGVKYGGKKGNISLHSFDGEYRVMVAIADLLMFDERIKAAKELIDECIRDWTSGSKAELRVLINDAFQVDKTGKINTKRVLSLRRLDIKDERWLRAMDAISDSIQIAGAKPYIRIYKRQTNGEYRQIDMDISAV
jgi:hypothetical protein